MTDNVIYGIDFQNPRAERIRRLEYRLTILAAEIAAYACGLSDTAPSEMNMDEPA